MDIYILRDGKETGPFSEEIAASLLKKGSVLTSDFAWRPGQQKWLPLSDLLDSATGSFRQHPPPPPVAGETAPAPDAAEPATAKQKVFLSYFGVPFAEGLAKKDASLLVNDVMEDPKNSGRLSEWNKDRLQLRPDLFSAEIQVLKENRASHYFEVCQTEGAEYFTKVTKAHCQVLVAYLDREFPNWDAHPASAPEKYFFPAVSKKFPQLLSKQWKGRSNLGDGPAGATKYTPKIPPQWLKQSPSRPLMAVARGLFFGALILAVLWVVLELTKGSFGKGRPALKAPSHPPAAAASKAAEQAPVPAPNPPPNLPELNSSPAREPVNPAVRSVSPAPVIVESPADPGALAPSDPAPPPMSNTEPPVPVPVPEATTPTASTVPPPGSDPAMSLPTPAPTATAPAPRTTPPGAKTNLVLTKPIEVQFAYGKIKLPVGTPLKLIARENTSVRVSYMNSVIVIAANSTDIDSVDAPGDRPPANGATPGASPAPAPVPPASPDL